MQGNETSRLPAISGDGRFVAFDSAASNLVAGDTNAKFDIFVRDRDMGLTTRVNVASTGAQSNATSIFPSISQDGRFVSFHSFATNLVPGDTNGTSDVFVHDRETGQTTRASVDSNGVQLGGFSLRGVLSADGRFVAFDSGARILVHDRETGRTEPVDVSSAGADGNGFGRHKAISADGRFVAFSNTASNLVAGDTNAGEDIFLHDRLTGLTARVSVDSNGGETDVGSISLKPAISAFSNMMSVSMVRGSATPAATVRPSGAMRCSSA